ncbi:MAG: alpha/beta fold hydrolase [Planctomycetes bacterium]|nr:alpha/beta fold hydrolase [Planctomycetota bacterium]
MNAPTGPQAKAAALAELAPTPFVSAWWAPSGIVQTVVAMRCADPMPALRTETWPTPDDDDVRVHFADVDDATAPLVLLLHGLEGSRESPYVRTTAALAHARGWRFCVLEFRSCGGVMNRARRTYHSGETTDLALVVQTLRQRFPRAPIFALGFSLGGNVLLKWLGEVGALAPPALVAAAAISPPFDLGVCARQCDERYGGRIARHFLRTLIPKAVAKHAQHPGSFDLAAVRRCRTFRAFDDLVTAPLHGFRDGAHYYATQSCGPFLPAIRRPTLLIAAVDDPLCRPEILPRAAVSASPFLLAQFPRGGGHVAFVDGGTPWRPRRWAEAQALRFFAQQLGVA